MKAVLMSTQPKWCADIENLKKPIEVRKSRPKLEIPFKVYIYCTNDRKVFLDSDCNNKFWTEKNYGGKHYYNGKVIGEFVCKGIMQPFDSLRLMAKQSCLTEEELFEYSKGKTLYGWRIADLKIYDKPKELSEFKHECNGYCLDSKKGIACQKVKDKREDIWGNCDRKLPITRPPQSWCYIEELHE